jgi:hypothetical protein
MRLGCCPRRSGWWLDVRVPRYQRDMVRYVAERDGTTVSDVVARELEGMPSAGFEELVGVVPGFAEAVGSVEVSRVGT